MTSGSFAEQLIDHLVQHHPQASFLAVKARGKTAAIGYHLDDEWIPLFRVASGSAAFNVANLEVRHKRTWAPTLVRGVPATIAEVLAGQLRFLWQLHIP